MDRESPTVLADLPSASAGAADSTHSGTETSVGEDHLKSPAGQPIAWASVWGLLIAMSAVAATAGLFIGGGHGRGLFISLLCFSTLLISAGFDSATGHIPNPITYTAILLGLSLNSLSPLLSRAAPQMADRWLGAAGPMQSLMGFVIFGVFGVVSLLLRGLGGGDMKLLAAVGALLGTSRAADAMLAALAVAVVYAVANLIAGGRLNAAIRFLCVQLLSALFPQAALPAASHRRRWCPMAIPVFLGLLLSVMPPVASAMRWLWGT